VLKQMQVKHFLIICKLILWCLWMKQDELDMVHQEFIYIYIISIPLWMSGLVTGHVCMPCLFHLELQICFDHNLCNLSNFRRSSAFIFVTVEMVLPWKISCCMWWIVLFCQIYKCYNIDFFFVLWNLQQNKIM